MESRSRNIWLVVIAAVIIICCCLVVLAGLGIGLATNWTQDLGWWTGWGTGLTTETLEQSFDVGQNPALTVDSFAGDVTVRASTADTIQVTATKRAPRTSDMGRVQVNFVQSAGGLRIEATRPGITAGNMSVSLEILTPPGTALDLTLGAGNVVIEGLTGGAQVDNGAGNIDIRSVEGQVGVRLGAGNINYEGLPSGDSRLTTGAGNIDLNLPTGANVRIDLNTSLGNVNISGFAVAGQVSRQSAQGTIGSGGDATITARTSAGNITLR